MVSVARMSRASPTPPLSAAVAPTAPPSASATITASPAMINDTRPPWITRLSTSRANESVPMGCAQLGGCQAPTVSCNCSSGAWGAIQGAASAAAKSARSAAPAHQRWRVT